MNSPQLTIIAGIIVLIVTAALLFARGKAIIDAFWVPGREKANDSKIAQIRQKVWERYTQEKDISKPSDEMPVVTLPAEIEQAYPDIKKSVEAQIQSAATAGAQKAQGVQNKDRAIAYLERIVDRIINKARGILPFNSIMIALLGASGPLFHLQGTLYKSVLGIAFLSLIVSSLLALRLFVVHWADISSFRSFNVEFENTLELVRSRSVALQFSIVCSAAALICVLLIFGAGFWAQASADDATAGLMHKEPAAAYSEQFRRELDAVSAEIRQLKDSAAANTQEVKQAYDEILQKRKKMQDGVDDAMRLLQSNRAQQEELKAQIERMRALLPADAKR